MATMALAIGADTVSTEQRRKDIIESLTNLPDGPELKTENKDTRVDAGLTSKGVLEKRFEVPSPEINQAFDFMLKGEGLRASFVE
ncbi:hypothetical protein Tco_0505728 [Tanacetum coccineum]